MSTLMECWYSNSPYLSKKIVGDIGVGNVNIHNTFGKFVECDKISFQDLGIEL